MDHIYFQENCYWMFPNRYLQLRRQKLEHHYNGIERLSQGHPMTLWDLDQLRSITLFLFFSTHLDSTDQNHIPCIFKVYHSTNTKQYLYCFYVYPLYSFILFIEQCARGYGDKAMDKTQVLPLWNFSSLKWLRKA